MWLLAALFLFASTKRIVSGAEWCYQAQVTCNDTCKGPDEWGEVSESCRGRAQSPVNIVTRKVLLDDRLTPFHLINYEETFEARLMNNGHTVQLDLPSNIKIEGGKLAASYKAIQFHLHWGKEGGPGSEHTIDGEQFPMEMHIVHIKEEYDSLPQAVRDPSGVAVLGFLFQEGTSDNKKYYPLINALKNITEPSDRTMLTGVSLDMFIPSRENLTRYFRYDGSLTTPSCDEAVVWSLFENVVLLSRNQLAAFSQLQDSTGEQMVKTYRPVQPMNGRQVFYSSGHVALVSTGLVIMSMLLSTTQPLHTAA